MKPRFSASLKCETGMTGIKGIPRRCAASTRAVPESSRLFSSIRHGTKKPKVSTLRANIIICFSGCLRGLRAFNVTEWIGTYSTVRRGALLRNGIKDFASVIVFLLGDPFAPYLYLHIYRVAEELPAAPRFHPVAPIEEVADPLT